LRDNSSTTINVPADDKKTSGKAKGSDTKEKKPRKPRLKSIEEITCPVCGKGNIIKGHTAYGCSEFRNGCNLRLPFDTYPADLTPAKLNTMIKKAYKQ
jgi:DNA topoisomerase-3